MEKIDNLIEDYDNIEVSDETLEKIGNLQDKIKDYRSVRLENDEFSYENLVFKFLRRNGYIQKLFDFKNGK